MDFFKMLVCPFSILELRTKQSSLRLGELKELEDYYDRVINKCIQIIFNCYSKGLYDIFVSNKCKCNVHIKFKHTQTNAQIQYLAYIHREVKKKKHLYACVCKILRTTPPAMTILEPILITKHQKVIIYFHDRRDRVKLSIDFVYVLDYLASTQQIFRV